MQIIQMADLHINDSYELQSIYKRIDLLFAAIEEELNPNEDKLCCILGDIIDKGNSDNYQKAKSVLNYIKEQLDILSIPLLILPGNHDLCNCPYKTPPSICPENLCTANDFEKFAQDFSLSNTHKESIALHNYDEMDVLVVNSVFHRNCKYGLVDIDALTKISICKPTLILTHHTFLSENDYDNSAIRNAYKIIDFIENKNVIGLLHGHTHGYKDIIIGRNCRIVGVGPFLKQIPNVNNQINIIDVYPSGIGKIKNFYFRADIDQYRHNLVFDGLKSSFYAGTSLKKLYQQVKDNTKRYGVIPNLIMRLTSPIHIFTKEIEHLFPSQIEDAKAWQASNVPENLYYNHGEYMQHDGYMGIDFVIKELRNKATSSRALIPLINFESVYKSGDGFLPSFDIIQFGFNEERKTKLVVDLYLRALEVNFFLKINLCEISLLCNKIAQEIRSITDVDITVIAFRAQYKEHFSCFAKAKIDILDEAEIVLLLNDNIQLIIEYLVEKSLASETVIEDKGVRKLSNSLNAVNKRKKIRYTIIAQMQNVIDKMEELKLECKKTSNYQLITKCEEKLQLAFEELIEELRGGLYDT